MMGEATLAVPAEHVEMFTRATLAEVEFQARCEADTSGEDQRMSRRLLAQDVALADQLVRGRPATAAKVHAAAATLAHACETMLRAVVVPRLVEQAEYGPIDEGDHLLPLVAAAEWATQNAVAMHGLAAQERRAVAA